jgi:hypothetical protein
MAKKKQPLKPESRLSSLIFSDKGEVSSSVEALPRDSNEKIELFVGKKFVNSMAHFFGKPLFELCSGETPEDKRGDLVCSDNEGSLIKIQVVEVVDPVNRHLTEMRNSYKNKLLRDCESVFALFEGCNLSLIDTGNAPFLPNLKKNLTAYHELAKNLEMFGHKIQALSVGNRSFEKWNIGSDHISITAYCERIEEYKCGLSYQFQWGGARMIKPDEDIKFLTKAISHKIDKKYSKPKEKFWLLAYSTSSSSIVLHNKEDMMAASKLLNQEEHPFDLVWYFFPYPDLNLGHLVQV